MVIRNGIGIIKYLKNSIGFLLGGNMRNRKNERLIGRSDKDLAYSLDNLCKKYAEVGFASIEEMGECLWEIAKGANKLGCYFKLQRVDSGTRYRLEDIDTFLKVAKRFLDTNSDDFFEITYMDGAEPGDQYLLTINDYDGNMEEFAEFIFIPFEDEEAALESNRGKKENKIIRYTEGLELDHDRKKRCTLLRADLSDFTVTKHLLIAHNGGITLKEDGAIRTITCSKGNGLDHFERIMIAYSGVSLDLMKEYLSKHRRAILDLANKSDASITEDEDGNYTIDDLRDNQAIFYVWHGTEDTELDKKKKKIATSH